MWKKEDASSRKCAVLFHCERQCHSIFYIYMCILLYILWIWVCSPYFSMPSIIQEQNISHRCYKVVWRKKKFWVPKYTRHSMQSSDAIWFWLCNTKKNMQVPKLEYSTDKRKSQITESSLEKTTHVNKICDLIF